jgi:hypothetical protein
MFHRPNRPKSNVPAFTGGYTCLDHMVDCPPLWSSVKVQMASGNAFDLSRYVDAS